MKSLTVFTPSYNRKHTIHRTYESLLRQTSRDFNWLIIDDGSSDGTREWVESLGRKIYSNGSSFDWMGRKQDVDSSDHFVVEVLHPSMSEALRIEYIYKPNGGLYTGYNVAYKTIQTELCVCIDSDDYMPDDAVEKIVKIWKNASTESISIGGIVGLDYNVVDKQPIGGSFSIANQFAFFQDLHHGGDTKQVMRTDLMRQVAPQIGYEGEKDFNPYYMLMQVCDKYPLIVVNENFCWVEYQTTGDSMSAGIWRQYFRSPNSYAKYRIMQLKMEHGNNFLSKLRLTVHYLSSCILASKRDWLQSANSKLWSVLLYPLGYVLSRLVIWKNRR